MVWCGRLGHGGVGHVRLGKTSTGIPILLTIMARLALLYEGKEQCIIHA